MLTADAAPRGTSYFSGKPAKPTPGENLSHALGEIKAIIASTKYLKGNKLFMKQSG